MWFVFIALTSLTGLLDFGFQPTIARNVAYVYAGARRLERTGTTQLTDELRVDYAFLSLLIETVRRTYRYIASLAALCLIFGGGYYVYWLSNSLASRFDVLSAWILYAIGSALNLYFAYLSPLLQGSGQVTAANKVNVLARMSFFLAAIVLLALDFRLLAVAIANLISVGVSRAVSYYYLSIELQKANAGRRTNKQAPQNLFPIIWHNSYRLGLVAVGAFLILRGNTLLASAFLSLEQTASYALTLQVFSIIAGVSAVAFTVHLPQINRHRIRGALDDLQKDFAFANLLAWIVYVPIACIVVMVGDDLVTAMGSKTGLLSFPAMVLVAITAFLELNHSNHALMITTTNRIPFVAAALFSGLAIFTVSLILLLCTSLGIWAFLISQAVVQAAYNNWQWPRENMRDLGLGFKTLLSLGATEFRNRLGRV